MAVNRSGYLRILWVVAVLFPFGAAGVYAQDVQSFGVGTESAHELAPADKALITKFNEASLNLIRDGLYDKAITTAESAVEISRATENPKGEALGYYYLALSWYHKGNFSESLKNHKKSLDLSREPGDKYRTGKSHYAIGQVLRRQGLYPEALRNFLEAVEIQRELGSREDLAQAYLGIAGLYGSYDEHAKGLKYYGTAKEIMVEIGNYRSMADCLVCMGRSLDAMGEFDDDQDRIHPQRNGRGVGHLDRCGAGDVEQGEEEPRRQNGRQASGLAQPIGAAGSGIDAETGVG